MKLNKVKCYICGTDFEGGSFDCCPYCGWLYYGFESELDPNEKDEGNLISINEAKRLVSKGKDIYGESLPKKH